jgi:uncharacterized protein
MSDLSSPLAGFTGAARLFPLPNLVFFPNVMQPLHIFEPRYRQMIADALESDRLIALVLTKPGWEKEYAGSPAIYPVATLGVIAADQRLDDGRYNILLRGLSRIQIVEEIPHKKLYRQAATELLVEAPLQDEAQERKLRRGLIKKAPSCLAQKGVIVRQFRKLLKSDLPLGALCDLITFALPLDVEFKQSLLEELDVEARAVQLLDHLSALTPPKAADLPFPPEFSMN